MDPISLTTAGEPAAILHTGLGALAALGFTMTPGPSGWDGRAEVGSATGRVLLGGFSRRMILDYSLTQGVVADQWQLTITPAMSGASGGLIGVNKAKKEMESVAVNVSGALRAAGHLPYG